MRLPPPEPSGTASFEICPRQTVYCTAKLILGGCCENTRRSEPRSLRSTPVLFKVRCRAALLSDLSANLQFGTTDREASFVFLSMAPVRISYADLQQNGEISPAVSRLLPDRLSKLFAVCGRRTFAPCCY